MNPSFNYEKQKNYMRWKYLKFICGLLDKLSYLCKYVFIPEKLQNVLNQQEESLCYACELEEGQKDLQRLGSLYWPKLCLSLLLLQPLLAKKKNNQNISISSFVYTTITDFWLFSPY